MLNIIGGVVLVSYTYKKALIGGRFGKDPLMLKLGGRQQKEKWKEKCRESCFSDITLEILREPFL